MSATETNIVGRGAERTDQAGVRQTARIWIEGMHCASCVARIESELERTPGVVEAAVNLTGEQATVVYEPRATGLAELEGAV